MKRIIDGLEGESTIRKMMSGWGIKNFQADIIIKSSKTGKWFLGEIKNQEPFEPPPFLGHGLPPWQIETRLNFQKDTGIRVILFVIDSKTKIIYWQFLDILMSKEKYQTTGQKTRIIFPLKNFNILRDMNSFLTQLEW